jgi:hypothetical protein
MHRTDAPTGRHRFRPFRPRPDRLAGAWQAAHGPRTGETRAQRRARLEAAADFAAYAERVSA